MFYMWDSPIGTGWWMVFGGIWMVAFWGGLIALIVWAIKKLVGGTSSRPDIIEKRQPLDIVRERYARGEISRDKFEQIRRDLS